VIQFEILGRTLQPIGPLEASLEVFGFDRGLRLLPDTAERFNKLLPITERVWQGEKWFVPYASFNVKRHVSKLTYIYLVEASGFQPDRFIC
jgi:hypothetical protein